MRFAFLATVLVGCECSEEPPCFEGQPTFGEIQSKIFDRSCNAFSTCHNSGAEISTTVGELNLCGPDSPDNDCDGRDTSPYERLVGVPASCGVGTRSCEDPDCDPETDIRVVPGDPEASYLYQRVSGEGLADCVRRMPYGTTDGLCAEGVDAIRTWIENGAKP